MFFGGNKKTRRLSKSDMNQFSMLPFRFDGRLVASSENERVPCAWMDLSQYNQEIAKATIRSISGYIEEIAPSLGIPSNHFKYLPDSLVFKAPSKMDGYTRLQCKPYTSSGRLAKYPVMLFFTTAIKDDVPSCASSETHGELYYGSNGSVQKGIVYHWQGVNGYFFHFKTINEVLLLSRVEYTNSTSNTHQSPAIVYDFK